jgi:hypothetical protein
MYDLLFISKSFFNSEYIEKEELMQILERHRKAAAQGHKYAIENLKCLGCSK